MLKIKIVIFAEMNEEKKITETPLMKQYFAVKAQHPEAMLLFRVGDFYETYGEDAVTASKVLGIVLTRRANGASKSVEMAGFPHHAIDTYLPKLVSGGFKVAICDQLEDPKLTKKIVKRGITELVTPGIAYSDQLLVQKENNFLCALYFTGSNSGGVAFLDISTGTFRVAEGSLDYIEVLLSDFSPKEIVIQREYKKGFQERFGTGYYLSTMEEWAFVPQACSEKLTKQLGVSSLKGFGIENLKLGITAAGAVLFYLENNYNSGSAHICTVSRIDRNDFVWLDRFTFRNLEIFASTVGTNGVSLLDVIDRTVSPLGGRLLRNWLSMPLKEITAINERHSIVSYFVQYPEILSLLREKLSKVGDLERITARAAAGKIMPREIMQLNRGLEQMGPIKELCMQSGEEPIVVLGKEIELFESLRAMITRKLAQEPAAQFGKGDIIADNVDDELDELRKIARHGKEYLLQLQQREIDKTGITSLKISYNNVFGYYLEVRNAHKEKVPQEWIRKQTLVNAERYITQELKEYEEKILGAKERITAIEQRIFAEIVSEIQKEIKLIQKSGVAIAKIDCLGGFALLAVENKYCRPVMDESLDLEIKQGRHPVIETLMPPGEEYVANDLFLGSDTQQIILLTGPNMAGKSALLRQTALIVLLAQIGSFVPANEARIGVVDKIFTRVGASDNISRGESTFMVEMTETSTILHNLSERSLVLLDEIGRGTSTFDGMSIAWAIVEFLHESGSRAKTLFATHYHELNELENIYPRVKNFHIAVKEVDSNVIFLRKLSPGGVAHSFGIHVAKMAGMPAKVVDSAQRILHRLENDEMTVNRSAKSPASKSLQGDKTQNSGMQLSFFQLEDPLLLDIKDKLMKMDINKMSPLDAFDALRELKKQTGLK